MDYNKQGKYGSIAIPSPVAQENPHERPAVRYPFRFPFVRIAA